jgi:hypothetical protein
MAEYTRRDTTAAAGLGAAGVGSYAGGRRLEGKANRAAARTGVRTALRRAQGISEEYARTGAAPAEITDLKNLNKPGIEGNKVRGKTAASALDAINNPQKIGSLRSWAGYKAAGKSAKGAGILAGVGAVGFGAKAVSDHKKERDFYKSADGEPTLRPLPTFGTIEKSTPISAFGVDHGDEEFSKAFPNLSAFAGGATNAMKKTPVVGPATTSAGASGQKFGGQLRKLGVGAKKNWKPVGAGAAAGGVGVAGGSAFMSNRNRGY